MCIIFVCRPFVAEMKGIDKGFSVGEILAVPLSVGIVWHLVDYA